MKMPQAILKYFIEITDGRLRELSRRRQPPKTLTPMWSYRWVRKMWRHYHFTVAENIFDDISMGSHFRRFSMCRRWWWWLFNICIDDISAVPIIVRHVLFEDEISQPMSHLCHVRHEESFARRHYEKITPMTQTLFAWNMITMKHYAVEHFGCITTFRRCRFSFFATFSSWPLTLRHYWHDIFIIISFFSTFSCFFLSLLTFLFTHYAISKYFHYKMRAENRHRWNINIDDITHCRDFDVADETLRHYDYFRWKRWQKDT